jgi:divalent metal cation (Fe/Co/Zn/Cd) transporter
MSATRQTRFANQPVLTAAQRNKESSVVRALWLDLTTFVFVLIAALASGSLTIAAELPRGGLLLTIEIISIITLYRSHRGKFAEFEYGIGKIERVISILIVGGLFLAAVFTLSATFERMVHPVILPTQAMLLAVAAASYNVMINCFCAGDFIRVNQHESSLILASQVKSRLAKIMASVIVTLILVLATWLSDPKAATLVDAVGSFFVIAYMVKTGVQMLRESLPDLLDRALPEREQLLLLRVITRYFDDFDNFGAIRSRRSGGHAFVDVDLEFPAGMPLGDAAERCDAIRRGIIELIPDAVVSVVPRVAGPAAAPVPA